jgi:betaine reductase
LCDIDEYAVELHNPEVTLPAGSGNVPLANCRALAALAVIEGEIGGGDIPLFGEERGMPGFAPTQGHIPAGVLYLGHAPERSKAGEFRSVMVMAKGSRFLGRMTQLPDGASVKFEV